MYQDHVSILNAGIRHDPDIFCKAVTFAVLSIRQQFLTAVQSLKEFSGVTDRHLWGYKRGSYDYLRQNKVALWRDACSSLASDDGLRILTAIPGLGIVKAAFVLQMMGHDIGCLDSRNINRLNLNPRQYRSDGEGRKNSPAFKRKIAEYVSETQGLAEKLWNDWCCDLAKNTLGVSGEEISAMHLAIVQGRVKEFRQGIVPVPVVTKAEIPL